MTTANENAIDEWIELERMRELWHSFELSKKKEVLDKQALDIAEQREKSANARKNLAQDTKSFKKLKETEKLAKFGKLLKSYQDEVDNLTRRSLAAETAFLEFYNALQDVPDPCASMANALIAKDELKMARASSEEVDHLKQQLKQYEEEFAKLTDQDFKIRKLEEKCLEYESKMSQRIDAESELLQEQFRERDLVLSQQVVQLREELDHVQLLYDNAQNDLFSVKTRNEELHTSQQIQLENAQEEISNLQNFITTLQSENEIFKERMSNNRPSTLSDEIGDELVNAQREAQIKQLTQNAQNLESRIDRKKAQIEQMQAVVSEQSTRILTLEQELAQRPSNEAHQNLKERCRVLESISFESLNDKDNLSNSSVEQLLSRKNKYLEDQITRTKRAGAEKEQLLKQVTEELEALRKKTSEQQELIAKLEDDLYHHNTAASDNQIIVSAETKSSPATPVTGKADPMLQIVTEQRNRFKKRVNELEEEMQTMAQKMDRLLSDLDTLQKDNVALYEKMRYLQSYNGNQSTYPETSSTTAFTLPIESHSSLRHVANKSHGDLEDPIGDKYKKLYEQKLDPFTKFHKDEKESQYQKLSAAEKITFSMTRLMMSHKYSRMFVFFYFLALHLLVFLVSYKLAHIPTCTYRR